ncbi:MAG: hypothetical protein AABW88_01925 [Nanoarchaeota archaeon]
MKCPRCSNEAKVPYPNGNLCENCYIDVLTARIKKDTKMNSPLNKGEKILVYGKLTEIFLRKAMPELPLEITTIDKKYKKTKNEEKYDRIVIPFTADDDAESFYSEITKKDPNLEEDKKVVKLFRTMLNEEVIKAAKILNVKIELNKNKKLNKIKKKFPQSIFGLRNAAEEFRKAIK